MTAPARIYDSPTESFRVGSMMAFYENSETTNLQTGDNVWFWSYADEANPERRCGAVSGFTLATEGEVVRVRIIDAAVFESAMLLTSSVRLVKAGES